jgi:nucleoside-diphosphate-sugar epimerase
MNEPVDYAELAAYLKKTRGLEGVPIKTPYRSTWLDNTKAKFILNWRPEYDLAKLTDSAFDYKRAPEDPRVIWYPG